MRVIPDELAQQIKEYIFSKFENPVELTAILGGQYKEDLKNLLMDLEEISDNKFKVKYIDESEADEIIKKYDLNIDNCGNRKGPILFYEDYPGVIDLGSPFDQEFTAFLEDLLEISHGHVHVPKKVEDYIKNIDREIDVLVFITPSCPHCPYMVKYAHTFALINPKIRGIMIEAYEFPEISDCYEVQAVPRNVIIDRKTKEKLADFEGRIPIVNFAEIVYKASKGEQIDLPF